MPNTKKIINYKFLSNVFTELDPTLCLLLSGTSVSGSLSFGASTWILDIPSGAWSRSHDQALPVRERGLERERRRGPCWRLARGNDLLRSFATVWFGLHICSTASSIFIFIISPLWHWNFLLSWAFLWAFFLLDFLFFFKKKTFPDIPLGFGLFSVSS